MEAFGHVMRSGATRPPAASGRARLRRCQGGTVEAVSDRGSVFDEFPPPGGTPSPGEGGLTPPPPSAEPVPEPVPDPPPTASSVDAAIAAKRAKQQNAKLKHKPVKQKTVAAAASGASGAKASKPFWRQRVLLPIWLWLLLGGGAVALIVLLTRSDDDVDTVSAPTVPTAPTASTASGVGEPQPLPEVVVTSVPVTTATVPLTTAALPTTVSPATAPPATTAPPTTSQAPTTIAPTTIAPTTTTAPIATAAPAPTAAPTTTIVPVPGAPAVAAVGIEGRCRFGPDCLIAGFTIANFPTQPQRFVCEFQDGSRFEYRFDTAAVLYACSTNSPTGSIVIEVDGVRSNTVTRG